MAIFLFDRLENAFGEKETPFPTVFPITCIYKAFFRYVVKSRDCVVKSKVAVKCEG